MNLNKLLTTWEHSPDIQEVLLYAEIVKHQIQVMGANDSEFNNIDIIVAQARQWVLDASWAILRLQSVINSKQDYH